MERWGGEYVEIGASVYVYRSYPIFPQNSQKKIMKYIANINEVSNAESVLINIGTVKSQSKNRKALTTLVTNALITADLIEVIRNIESSADVTKFSYKNPLNFSKSTGKFLADGAPEISEICAAEIVTKLLNYEALTITPEELAESYLLLDVDPEVRKR